MIITKENVLTIVNKTSTSEINLIDWSYDNNINPETNLINFINSFAHHRYLDGYNDATELLSSALN